jgi:hypothetical protein
VRERLGKMCVRACVRVCVRVYACLCVSMKVARCFQNKEIEGMNLVVILF